MNLTKLITLSVFFSIPIIAGGFVEGTLVKTAQGYTEIQNLRIGDLVLTCDFQDHCTERRVTHQAQTRAASHIEIKSKSETIRCAIDQTFYDFLSKEWKAANELSGTIVNEPAVLYAITVDDHHNFFVSRDDLLVHNVFLQLIAIIPHLAAIAIPDILVAAGILGIGGAIVAPAVKNLAQMMSSSGGQSMSDANLGVGGAHGRPLDITMPNDEDTTVVPVAFEGWALPNIFRDAPGHLKDTVANRQLIGTLASNANNYIGVDRSHDSIFAKALADGDRIWARVVKRERGNYFWLRIEGGGINNLPDIYKKIDSYHLDGPLQSEALDAKLERKPKEVKSPSAEANAQKPEGPGWKLVRMFKNLLRSRDDDEDRTPKGDSPTAQVAIDRVMKVVKPDGRWIGTKGTSTRIRELEGTASDARTFFDKLTVDCKDKREIDGRIIADLKGNAGFIVYREISKSGPPTIEINIHAHGNVIKFKFKN